MPNIAAVQAPLRRTKIIFTLGPATESETMLEKLIRAGADVARLNMAHASHEWVRTVVRRIRSVSSRVGRDISIMMDIKGPEIRTGDVAAPMELKAGEIFDFTVKPGGAEAEAPQEEVRSVNVNYQDLVKDIAVGDTVLVDNGLIRLEVLEKKDANIRCRVLIAGELKSRRHINLPGVKVNLPSFTENDRADTMVGIEEGVDYIALSFVREAADINLLRDFLIQQRSPPSSSPRSRTSPPSKISTISSPPPMRSWWHAATSASSAPSKTSPSSSAAPCAPAMSTANRSSSPRTCSNR